MAAIRFPNIPRLLARGNPGPLFTKELRMSSRRPRFFFLRLMYVCVVLVFIVLMWMSTVERVNTAEAATRVDQMKSAGQDIVITVSWVQFIAGQLIAVLLLSTSINGEIYHRTMIPLLTTPITAEQLVLGKFFGRLLHVVVLLAVSLPILAIVRVMGGIPWNYVAGAVFITLTACMFAGAMAMLYSVIIDKSIATILATLGTLIGIYMILPVVFMIFTGIYSAITGSGQVWSPMVYFNPIGGMFWMTQILRDATNRQTLDFSWPLHCLCMLFMTALALWFCVLAVKKYGLRRAVNSIGGDSTSVVPVMIMPIRGASGTTRSYAVSRAVPGAQPPRISRGDAFEDLSAHPEIVRRRASPVSPTVGQKEATEADDSRREALAKEVTRKHLQQWATGEPIEPVREEPADEEKPAQPARHTPPPPPKPRHRPPAHRPPPPGLPHSVASRAGLIPIQPKKVKLREIKGSPILWRELLKPMLGNKTITIVVLTVALATLGQGYFMVFAAGGMDEGETHAFFVLVFLALAGLITTFLAATSITSEKESRCWMILLSTPMEDRAILWGKVAGVLRRSLPAWLFLTGHLLLFTILGHISPGGAAILTLIGLYTMVFLTSLGIYFSAVYRRTISAVLMTFGIAALAWLVIPGLAEMAVAILELPKHPSFADHIWSTVPFVQAGHIAESVVDESYKWAEDAGRSPLPPVTLPSGRMSTPEAFTIVFVIGMTYIGASALLLWRAACRFRRNIV
ncbi:MAG: ABC transporter permease [Phycisphaerae bacterium]